MKNEIRIGNLFEHGIIIESISEYGYNYTNYPEMGVFWSFFENLKPIKLDEEWFLKCESNSIFNNGFTYKKTSTSRFEIYVGMSLITVIEFVHELQNLNFALLGEDVVFEN